MKRHAPHATSWILAGAAALFLVGAACSASDTGGNQPSGAGGTTGASTSHRSASSTAESTGNVLVTTGTSTSSTSSTTSGPTSSHAVTTTSATSSPSSSGTGGATSCDVFTADECGNCLEANCCAEIIDCENADLCQRCLAGDTTVGCANDSELQAIFSCEQDHCGAVVMSQPECCAPPYIASDPCHLPPPDWTCDASLWDETYQGTANPVCNCSCGDVRDPDCDTATVDDCGAGFFCAGCGCIPTGNACQ